MGLARADAAVKHQRIVAAARLIGDLHGRRHGQLVARSFHEIGQIGEAAAILL